MSKQFEVGQLWRTRDGSLVRIKKHGVLGLQFPIYGTVWKEGDGSVLDDNHFDSEGRINRFQDDRLDLVELLKDAPPALVLYVAGPMSGYPDLNFPAFHAKAAELRAAGYVVINPAEINGGADELVACASMTPEELQAHWQKCMRKDITELCKCDGIAMLDGWTRSKGATLEHHVAKSLGLLVIEATA